MAVGFIEKLTNFFMPVEEMVPVENSVSRGTDPKDLLTDAERRAGLRLHTVGTSSFKVFVHAPASFDDVKSYADYLRVGVAVIINYQQMDASIQQKMSDFLNGVCYILDGAVQRISDQVIIYAPTGVTIDKELCSLPIPTYIKRKSE